MHGLKLTHLGLFCLYVLFFPVFFSANRRVGSYKDFEVYVERNRSGYKPGGANCIQLVMIGLASSLALACCLTEYPQPHKIYLRACARAKATDGVLPPPGRLLALSLSLRIRRDFAAFQLNTGTVCM